MNREQFVEWLRNHGGCRGTLDIESREQLADLLAADYLTPETLRDLVAARDSIHSGGFGCSTLDSIIARLSPPPVVKWVDVGDGAIAECGGWTLVVRPRSSATGYVWTVTRPDRRSDTCCWVDTKAEAKAAAESKLAELMRGA